MLFVAVLLAFVETVASEKDNSLEKPCQSYVDQAGQLNPRVLWQGYRVCENQQQFLYANFLLLAGQLRAATDMGILQPMDERERLLVGKTYFAFRYEYSGFGEPVVYHEKAMSDQLVGLLGVWQAEIDEEYIADWAYDFNYSSDDYAMALYCNKEIRMLQIQRHIALMQNEDYYSAKQSLSKLVQENQSEVFAVFSQNSEFQKEEQRLRKIMAKIELNLTNHDVAPSAKCLSFNE